MCGGGDKGEMEKPGLRRLEACRQHRNQVAHWFAVEWLAMKGNSCRQAKAVYVRE